MIMLRRTALLTLGAMAMSPAHALYDPKPIALLELATGTWLGSLTYRDYQRSDKMVTLDTQMTVSLVAPDELSLYYVFDDGPAKTVYSYERMKLDLGANQLVWQSGTSKPGRTEYAITSSMVADGKSQITFEKITDAYRDKYDLEISKSNWLLTKHERNPAGAEILRSKYIFKKRES